MMAPVVVSLSVFAAVLVYVEVVTDHQMEANEVMFNKILPVYDSLEGADKDLYQVKEAGQNLALALSNSTVYREMKAEYQDNVHKPVKRIEDARQLVADGILPSHLIRDIDQFQTTYKPWKAKYDELFSEGQSVRFYYDTNFIQMDEMFKKLRKHLKAVMNEMESVRDRQVKDNIDYLNSSEVIIETFSVIAVIATLLLSFMMSSVLIAPLTRLQTAMKEISEGDGDLTLRVKVESKDEIGALASSFNTFVEKIQGTVDQVINSSSDVRNETMNISDVSTSISKASQAQQAESHQVASAVSQLHATSQEVAQHAQEAAAASGNAESEAGMAKEVLDETISSIEALSGKIHNSEEVINVLEQDVENIASVLDVIRGIAEQTNLLALNAAIEAARAGEQGRGFAVVADEVRTLASKTQESTGEIQSMIEKLQEGTAQAVSSMAESRKTGDQTVEQAAKAGGSLDSIASSIVVINEMNAQIATAAEEQSSVSNEINLNMQRIADHTESMAKLVDTAEDACSTLADQCKKLDETVEQFKV